MVRASPLGPSQSLQAVSPSPSPSPQNNDSSLTLGITQLYAQELSPGSESSIAGTFVAPMSGNVMELSLLGVKVVWNFCSSCGTFLGVTFPVT